MRTFKFMNKVTIGRPAAPQTPLLSRGASSPGSLVLNFSEYELCRTWCLEVYTIFGSEHLGGLMFDAILSEGLEGEALWESRGVWGAAGPP